MSSQCVKPKCPDNLCQRNAKQFMEQQCQDILWHKNVRQFVEKIRSTIS